jgi:tetratricopeptide (TPR) repeat protein
MAKTIIVLFARESGSVARILTRLQTHFGARRVRAAPGRLPPSVTHSVIVVLLSATDALEGDAGGGLPLDDFGTWDATGLDALLRGNALVLPMLLDGASMPAHTSIPEPYRKIAFKHALPIRCGAELDRDVGRLITDLEQHLQYSPAKIFAWDHWLVPLGATGAVICSPFLMLWLWDAWFWNYGYVTSAQYRQTCWWFTELGPLLLGAFLFLMSAGFAYGQHRRHVVARAEHFHTGKGAPPPANNRWLMAACIFTWCSLGWGWWTGGLAIVALIGAFASSARTHAPRPNWRSVTWILAVSIGASAWGLWRDALTDRLETAFRENDLGRAALDAGALAEAKSHFESAISAYPTLGRSYESLGMFYARQKQNPEAYRAFSRAISLYPEVSDFWFGPDEDQIAATFRYRAQVARQLGQTDSAKADEMQADKLTPFANLFKDLFDFGDGEG